VKRRSNEGLESFSPSYSKGRPGSRNRRLPPPPTQMRCWAKTMGNRKSQNDTGRTSGGDTEGLLFACTDACGDQIDRNDFRGRATNFAAGYLHLWMKFHPEAWIYLGEDPQADRFLAFDEIMIESVNAVSHDREANLALPLDQHAMCSVLNGRGGFL
jgi:hypothetical protein